MPSNVLSLDQCQVVHLLPPYSLEVDNSEIIEILVDWKARPDESAVSTTFLYADGRLSNADKYRPENLGSLVRGLALGSAAVIRDQTSRYVWSPLI